MVSPEKMSFLFFFSVQVIQRFVETSKTLIIKEAEKNEIIELKSVVNETVKT